MRSDLAVALLDAVLVGAAFVAMLLLRYDGSVPAGRWDSLVGFLPVAVGVVVLSNWAWGLYGQLWRHASLYEARRLTMSGHRAGDPDDVRVRTPQRAHLGGVQRLARRDVPDGGAAVPVAAVLVPPNAERARDAAWS
jgi:hypothetical protein